MKYLVDKTYGQPDGSAVIPVGRVTVAADCAGMANVFTELRDMRLTSAELRALGESLVSAAREIDATPSVQAYNRTVLIRTPSVCTFARCEVDSEGSCRFTCGRDDDPLAPPSTVSFPAEQVREFAEHIVYLCGDALAAKEACHA